MNFHQFLMQSLSGASVKPEDIDLDTQFCPTLLIGLGGTGAQVLLRVKKLLRDRLQGVEGLHRFVYIDTDTSTFAGQPGLPPIEGNEKCLVGVRKAKATVANPDYHKWLWKRFPRDELAPQYIRRLVSGNGASQIRSLGAIALVLDHAEVRAKIAAAHADLLALSSRVTVQVKDNVQAVSSNILVYIVGSVAGGTGSGCFLDVAMIAKDVCRRDESNLVGMFAVANRSFAQKVRRDRSQYERMRSNTYAALKELQYVMDANAFRNEPIEFLYGADSSLELAPDDSLFDLAFLIDDRNQLGTLPTLEDMYDLMARTVYQDVGSVLGAAKRSFDSNVAIATTDFCKVTDLPRMFGSVATTSMVYPAERVATYASLRALEHVIRDEILGTATKLKQIKGSVSGFLAAVELEERGDNNRLLERLLHDDENDELLSVSTDGLGRTWGAERNAREFADRILETRRHFGASRLAEVKAVVNRSFDAILGSEETGLGDVFKERIDEFALDVAAKRGVDTAVATLEDLEDTVEQMTRELELELRAWYDREKPAAEQSFNDACARLRSMGFLKQALSSKDERLKASLVGQYNDLVENEFWGIAKPKAIQVLKIVKSRVAEARSAWTGIQNDLNQVSRELSSTWRGLETHAGATSRGFVVVQEVTSPGYERRYYDKLGMSSAQFLTELMKKFAVRNNLTEKDPPKDRLLAWMHDLENVGRGERLAREMTECLFATVAPPLLGTNIVDFIRANPKEVGDSLGQKLDLMYAMCQPFWPATPPRADQEFSEFIALTVKQRWNGKEMVPPAIIKKWADQHGQGHGGDDNDTIHTNIPYEIVLSRRTYGARAFYMDPITEWKQYYDHVQKSSKGKYMVETHRAFLHAPSPMPENEEPQLYFSLGVALGFIVTRGDWYYFGLDHVESASGQDSMQILFDSQSETVFTLTGKEFPKDLGNLDLVPDRPKRIQNQWKLAQGREKATTALTNKRDWFEILKEAVNEYHRMVGNSTFREQIKKYRDRVLKSRRSKDGDDVYSKEYKLVTSKMNSIGK